MTEITVHMERNITVDITKLVVDRKQIFVQMRDEPRPVTRTVCLKTINTKTPDKCYTLFVDAALLADYMGRRDVKPHQSELIGRGNWSSVLVKQTIALKDKET
jgi:hypothetical protein